MMTYGDGVSDVNVKDLLAFHRHWQSDASLEAAEITLGAITLSTFVFRLFLPFAGEVQHAMQH